MLEQQQAAISTAEAVSGQQKAAVEKAEQDLKQAKDLLKEADLADGDARRADRVRRGEIDVSIGVAQHRGREGELEPGARSTFEDDDLFAARRRGHGLNSKLGERVVATNQFAGTEVMRVADLNHMQAVVDVNENDVVHVKIGDSAKSRSMPMAIENSKARSNRSLTPVRQPARARRKK